MTYIKTFLSSYNVLKNEYDENPEKFIKRYKKYEVFIGSAESTDFIFEKLSYKFV